MIGGLWVLDRHEVPMHALKATRFSHVVPILAVPLAVVILQQYGRSFRRGQLLSVLELSAVSVGDQLSAVSNVDHQLMASHTAPDWEMTTEAAAALNDGVRFKVAVTQRHSGGVSSMQVPCTHGVSAIY